MRTVRFVIFTFTCLFIIGAPGSGAGEHDAGYESSSVCKECHQDIFRNWRNSLHALSFTNPIFQAAYNKAYVQTKGEAKKYCLNCHAPTVRVTGDYDAELPITMEGVTCDFCHTVSSIDLVNGGDPFTVSPGEVKRSVLKDAESPHHKTEYSADFASSKLCAGCHSFKNRHGVAVGDTYNEWKSSQSAEEGKQCQNCHMHEIAGKTATEGGRDKIHDHSLSHNLATMREAVKVKFIQTGKPGSRLSVQVEIHNAKAGHYVPTGTPERKLVLEVQTLDAAGGTLESQKRIYSKTIVDSDGKEISSDGDVFLHGVRISEDNRLAPGEKRVEKFVFSRRVKDIFKVSANVYFLYEPLVTHRTTMKIPFYSEDVFLKGQ